MAAAARNSPCSLPPLHAAAVLYSRSICVFYNQYSTQCHISQMTSQRAAKPSCIGAQAISHTAMILFLPSVLSGSESPSMP